MVALDLAIISCPDAMGADWDELVNDLASILKNSVIICGFIDDITTTKETNVQMVHEIKWKKRIILECELCGLGYGDVETTEHCGQYCRLHGSPSPTLTQKSLRKMPVQVDPIPDPRGEAPRSW